MRIFPAIDVRGGKAVRLYQGDYGKMTVCADDPAETAKGFREQGARSLHVVDLDGAKDGEPVNFGVIERIIAGGGMPVQVGGGIRDEERVSRYLSLGVERVILGTAAVRDFDFLLEMVRRHGGRIAVGVDVRDELVAVSGWQETTAVNGFDFCKKLRDAGVETVIYTDISKDGTLSGTNLSAYGRLSEIEGLNIIASGGISHESEIVELRSRGIYGAILGKALYSGKLSLPRAIELGER